MAKKDASAVYFSDLRAKAKKDLLGKLAKLLERTGLKSKIRKNALVAVKIHFGEKGNTAYVRPVFVRPVITAIRKNGGKPLVTVLVVDEIGRDGSCPFPVG